jgi:NADPH:quinone reductase
MKSIVLEHYGDPENLNLKGIPCKEPAPRQALVRIAAVGVNFMDVGTRTGVYRQAPLPMTPGVEGTGRIVALGDGVDDLKVADRVAWFYAIGTYAEETVAPAEALVPIPDEINDETAASLKM